MKDSKNLPWHQIKFDVMGDERGSLTAIENHKNIPFAIQRVYYIYHTLPKVRRGFHAHQDLEQVAICVSGSCTFLLDNGVVKQEVSLNNPTSALYIGAMVWREMFDFSDDCVLMVLASRLYDEADYIRSYDDFLKVAQ